MKKRGKYHMSKILDKLQDELRKIEIQMDELDEKKSKIEEKMIQEEMKEFDKLKKKSGLSLGEIEKIVMEHKRG